MVNFVSLFVVIYGNLYLLSWLIIVLYYKINIIILVLFYGGWMVNKLIIRFNFKCILFFIFYNVFCIVCCKNICIYY